MASWGHWKLANCVVTDCQTWKTWGFGGFIATLGGTGRLNGYGDTQRFKVSSGTTVVSPVGDATTAYDWQRAFMGLGAPSINGGTQDAVLTGGGGVGPFKAKQADSSIYCGMSVRFAKTGASGGPFGDIFDTALRADVAAQLANLAAGVKFLGGDVVGLDLEEGQWYDGNTAPAGHTTAATHAAYEAWGYACGMAMYAAAPSIDLMVYTTHWGGSYYEAVTSAIDNTVDNRVQLHFGFMRAHRDSNATGRHVFVDADLGYRDTTVNRCKLNSQGILAKVSTTLADPTVWSHIAPYFYVSLFSWAGTDGTTFYDNSQPGQPTFTNWLEIHRQWGMGVRAEFNRFGHPGRNSTEGGEGLYAAGNNYLTPAGRTALMLSPAASTAAVSTTIPTFSTATASASSGTVTIASNVFHAWGTWNVKVYRGSTFNLANPEASLLGAMPMTWNQNGGSLATNFNTAFMACTFSTTGNAGDWFVLKATSIKSDVAWTRVQAT